MSLFRKKEQDEWDILDEAYRIDDPEQEQKTRKPDKGKRNKKKNESARVEEAESYDEIDYLSSEYVYDPEDDRPRFNWPLFFSIFFLIFFVAGGLCGYANTDFDENGIAYVVPLEIHYERRYVKESDKVLEECIEIANSIESDGISLINNFVYLSTKLSSESASLSRDTTELSRFIGVPTSMEAYHAALLNFSIKTQKFIQTLLDNYTHQDYRLFLDKGVSDLKSELRTLLNLRNQIDREIFRNME